MTIDNINSDSVRFCSTILDVTTPNENYCIVNIARVKDAIFYPTGLGKMSPQSYGYKFDKTPQFLIESKVILGMIKEHWYVGVEKRQSDDIDEITRIAHEVGYFGPEKTSGYYSAWRGGIEHNGPFSDYPNQYSVIVDIKAAKHFISMIEGSVPIYDPDMRSLIFRNIKISFQGYQALGIELLVKNINSIVTYKDFYCAVYDKQAEDYDAEIKNSSDKATGVHAKLDSVYKQIQTKIYGSEIGNYLVIAQHIGFGLFVNQKMINISTT